MTTTYNYLYFEFDLGYGDGLPVILPISNDQKQDFINIKNDDSIDPDTFIALDENYITIGSFLNHLKIIETNTPIAIPDKHQEWVTKILQYIQEPVTIDEILPPLNNDEISPTVGPSKQNEELKLTEDFINRVKQYINNPNVSEENESAILQRLGQDTRYISSLEDALTSAMLFGVCIHCESVKHEEGCLTCISYGEE